MGKSYKACGATGLAEALNAALTKTWAPDEELALLEQFHDVFPKQVGVIHGGKTLAGRQWAKDNGATVITQEAFDKVSGRTSLPDPAEQRKVREEQAKRIAKLSSIIKRNDPRLFMEVLQDFGSIEGLNAKRQADLIARLEKIKADYRL